MSADPMNNLLERATIAQERASAEYAEGLKRYAADRRERIATAVLQGLMAQSYGCGPSWEAAEVAINFADALIAKLDEEPQP